VFSVVSSSVFTDAPPKEVDGLGEESRIWIIWTVDVSHPIGSAEFSRDAMRFMVIIA